MRIIFVGHATMIVEAAKCRFITDPLLVKRIARIGPKRKVQFGLEEEALEDLDFITISHGHFDHLDIRSLKMIDSDVPVLCHPTLERIVRKTNHRVLPIRWWEEADVGCAKVTAVPAHHFSARPPFHYSLDYQGYVIECERNFYHAGDTGMGRHFRRIGRRFRIDVAFLPIGAYHPKSFRFHHLSPEDALDSMETMKADLLVPMHWGTFDLSWEAFDEPPKRLMKYAKERNMVSRIRILRPGESLEFQDCMLRNQTNPVSATCSSLAE